MSPSRMEEPPHANPATAVDDGDLSDSPVPPPPRERKKPLRTYGKRSAQSLEADAVPQKKQKLKEETTPQVAEPEPKSTPPPPKVSQKEPPKRGSIMSYFKPAPPSSRASSPPPPSPPAERELTPPPSSPPMAFKARKRRLTTRPRIDRDDTATRIGGSEERDGQEDGDNTRDGEHNDRDQSLPPPGKSKSGLEQRPILAEDTMGTSNRLLKLAEKEAGKKGKPGKRQTKERVQMTLSLAINPGPGFTVCKECEVLYNPLNEKDRKEHKKQHAAYVRAKLRSQTV